MTALLAELTRTAVARRAPDAVAVVPVGACEQHGPHLPLGTDLMVAEHLARDAADRLAGSVDVVVAPGVAVGYSPHHVPIGATLTAGWARCWPSCATPAPGWRRPGSAGSSCSTGTAATPS